MLELVGLSAAADRRVGGFSLGMRQRLALATTLLGDPRVLLLDEPANGLDPEGIRWLRGFLRMLAAEGRTVLVSSHVLSEVEQTVDDVVIIARGRLAHASSLPDLARMARVQVRAVSPDAAGLAALVERSAWTRTDAGDPRVAELWDVDAATVGAAAFAAGVELHELTSRDPGSKGCSSSSSAPSRPARGGCLMRAALVTEYRKLVTTRLWWILLLCMAVYMAFLSAVLGWGISQGGGMASTAPGGRTTSRSAPDAVVRAVYTVAVTFGYVFPLLVGALAVASEFRHQTITPTLLAEPRRTVLVSAKVVSAGVLGLVYGVVGTLAAVGAGAAVLTLLDQPTFLDQASTWRTIALSALALALWAVVGVGFGSVLTNQVAVIVVVLAFTQFVEPVLRFVLALTSWGAGRRRVPAGCRRGGGLGRQLLLRDRRRVAARVVAGRPRAARVRGRLAAIGRVTTFRRDIT